LWIITAASALLMQNEQIPIFLINLDRSAARLQRMAERLEKLGLTFERVPAIDGSILTDSEKEALNPPRIWQTKKSSADIGCYASHLMAIRLIVNRQLPRAIILEDDAMFDDDFDAWARSDCPLPEGTDILKLEGFGALNTIRIPIAHYKNRPITFAYKSTGGAAAYLVTLTGAKKALEKLNIVRGQIDDDLFAYWKNGLKIYEVFPFPARQDGIDKNKPGWGETERPLSLRLSRYVMRSYFKAKRFHFVVRTFGIKPMLANIR
jgi:glycosyl transferase, family 25